MAIEVLSDVTRQGASAFDVPVNGEPGGIRMNFDVNTTEEKPGIGKIRFNADKTQMYIDEMMGSGANLSALWGILNADWYCLIKIATNFNTQLLIVKGSGNVVDNTDWFKWPITVLSSIGTTFNNADKLVLQFFGGSGAAAAVTEAAILAAGNFMRYVSESPGVYKILNKDGVEIKASSQVFKLPGFSIADVEDLPAANTYQHGAVVRLHQDILVGVGSNQLGIYVVADAVNNIWRPFGRQILFRKSFGDLAAPTCSLTAAGKFDLGGADPVIPALLLNSDSISNLYLRYRKVGATTPTIRANLGTDLTVRGNNSIVYQNALTASTNLNTIADTRLSFVSATKLVSTRAAVRGGGGAANSFLDCATLIDIASAMKITIEASTLASDAVDLLEFELAWEY